MDAWTRVIYDATGIPLREEELTWVHRDAGWWLLLHGHPVLPVGADPSAVAVAPAGLREALAEAMAHRLRASIPRARRLLEALDPTHAARIAITVVNTEAMGALDTDAQAFEGGWPHFGLRLSAGALDVEVDLDPYRPEDPFDPDELKSQARVILQVATATSGAP